MSQLAPCPYCQRHLRITERVCPFCEADVAGALAARARPAVSTRGLSRASILALGASLAAVAGSATLEGCAVEPDPTDDDDMEGPGGGGDGGAKYDAGQPQPVYGAPIQQDAGGANTPPNLGGGVAIYGAPVQPFDAGHVVPLYGAPVQPIDAGQNDAGKADAGVSDGGKADASADAGKDAGRDWDDGGRVQPVYGAPVALYGAPIQPAIDVDEN